MTGERESQLPSSIEIRNAFSSRLGSAFPIFQSGDRIFKKELETIDVFGPFCRFVMSWNTNVIELGFSPNAFARDAAGCIVIRTTISRI